MTISTTKKIAGVAAAAGLLYALAGCGAAPEDTTSTSGAGATSGAEKPADSNFKPCIVSDDGDFIGLAARIQEAGLLVYGFGHRRQAQREMIAACDGFLFLDEA